MATVDTWDHACDLLVVGAGGGLAGALAGVEKGLDVLVIEKSAYVGGATSLSGGTLWILDNPFLKATGVADSPANANAHLRALVRDDPSPAASPARLEAYVSGGHALLDLMARQGVPLAHSGWPDYYSERDGGVPQGRTLHALPFDSRKLGEARDQLRPTMLVVPANSVEVAVLALGPRTLKAAVVWARVGLRTLMAKITGAKLLTRGQALMGRVFGALLKAGVPIWRKTRLIDLVVEHGRVTGAVVEREGKTLRIQARRGVLLAAGGFARNAELRAKHQDTIGVGGTMSTREDEGDAIRIGAELGAAVDLMEEAWWVPGTRSPTSVSLHVWDRCFPHAIMVDARGERFVNEADPYMEVGQIMLARQRANGAPSWMILESRHRDTYAFGMTPPRLTPKAWFESGYMKKAQTLEDLADQCGLDPAVFKATVQRFNGFARSGKDADFQRGDSVYNRFYGDGRNKPNPNLGAIEKAPFYAVQTFPGDVGTAGGLVADEHARVLTPDGAPIPGLYVAGNSSASVFGHMYPGAGSSIGASMVFSVIAAQHAAGVNAAPGAAE
ncbi:MAG: FAD-binding protein [Alphaproteobacteria bacterium]|nr:FAD-binding protein [Alphaproteobacteria bacterium]MBU1515391.1 FAD-binding protein [Alphaproteobacteria bacterium]MBU2092974.1 FAD-binding protein [Alphaproteobacteria bacterium]MBU2150122.1 FAD-binding protein [Alphaproteobacteria bacterium]MBU2309919.1 FAD-binding protein [Alphaproteobacteria bacterium]